MANNAIVHIRTLRVAVLSLFCLTPIQFLSLIIGSDREGKDHVHVLLFTLITRSLNKRTRAACRTHLYTPPSHRRRRALLYVSIVHTHGKYESSFRITSVDLIQVCVI